MLDGAVEATVFLCSSTLKNEKGYVHSFYFLMYLFSIYLPMLLFKLSKSKNKSVTHVYGPFYHFGYHITVFNFFLKMRCDHKIIDE